MKKINKLEKIETDSDPENKSIVPYSRKSFRELWLQHTGHIPDRGNYT